MMNNAEQMCPQIRRPRRSLQEQERARERIARAEAEWRIAAAAARWAGAEIQLVAEEVPITTGFMQWLGVMRTSFGTENDGESCM